MFLQKISASNICLNTGVGQQVSSKALFSYFPAGSDGWNNSLQI